MSDRSILAIAARRPGRWRLPRARLACLGAASALALGAAGAARADTFEFLGTITRVPQYGAQPTGQQGSGFGPLSTTTFNDTGDLFSASSYTNNQQPGTGDTIIATGVPPGCCNVIEGPPSSINGVPVFGYPVGGYLGNGMSVFTGDGAVGALDVSGPAVLAPGTITVTGLLQLNAFGDYPLYNWVFVPPSSASPVLTGQSVPVSLKVSGGTLNADTAAISTYSDNQSLPGTIEISGTKLTAQALYFYTGGNFAGGNPPTGQVNLITIDNGATVTGVQTLALADVPLDGSILPASNTIVKVQDASLVAGQLDIGADLPGPPGLTGSKATLLVNDGNITVNQFLAVGVNVPGELDATGATTINTNQTSYIALLQGSGGSNVSLDGSGVLWDDAARLYVGGNDKGSMTVTNGAKFVSADLLVVGLNPGGTGNLTISNGGSVISDNPAGSLNLSGELASEPGAAGTVDITGQGSSWDNLQSLAVGYAGPGSLTVENGGSLMVEGAEIRVGRDPTGVGDLTVTGDGSTVVAPNAVLYDGFGGVGTVNIQAGANVQIGGIDIAGKDPAGDIGAGVLNLTGAQLTVTAAGGNGINLPMVIIGDAGNGQLNVSGGARLDLSGASVDVGAQPGSSGALIVDSSNGASNIKLGSQTIIGDGGRGSLQITGSGPGDQSSISLNDHLLVGNQVGSTGTVSITNATLDVGGNQAAGSLILGYQGKGSLDVGQGGALISTGFMLGSHDQGTGVISLNDASATATVNGDTAVGAAKGATGEIDLSKGSTFTTTTLTVAGVAGSTGTVDDSGGTLKVNGAFNVGADGMASNGSVSLHDGATATVQDMQVASLAGTASVTVSSGATLNFSSLTIHDKGVVDFDQGTANGANGFFGGPGVMMDGGTLTVENGGAFNAGAVSADFGADLNFNGAASSVNLSSLTVHSSDPATPTSLDVSSKLSVTGGSIQLFDSTTTIASGADITAAQLSIDTEAGGSTSITGGKINVTGALFSGACCSFTVQGSGAFTVSGAMVQINGGFSTASPVSTINSDPTFQVSGDFDVNRLGGLVLDNSSVVTVTAGAVNVNNGSLIVTNASSLVMSGSNSTVNIDGALGVLSIQNGGQLLSVNTVNVGVTGGGTFGVHGSNAFVAQQVSVTLGTIDVTGGALWIGSGPGGGPSVTVSGQTYASSYVYVGSGGLLTGVGTIDGTVIVQGGAKSGVFHDGDDPGTITITGDYVEATGGQLELEVGPGSYSKLIVGGKVVLNGGTIVLQSFQGAQLDVGQQYDFIQAAGGITGQVDSIVSPNGMITLAPAIVGDSLMLTAEHVAGAFAATAATPNERAVARALDAAATQMAPALLPVVDVLSNQSAITAATWDQLSPEGLVGGQDAMFEAQRGFDRLAAGAAAPPGSPGAAAINAAVAGGDGRVWFAAFGGDAALGRDEPTNVAAAEIHDSGFAVGADVAFDAGRLGTGRIGLAVGPSASGFGVAARDAGGEITGVHASLYGGVSNGALYASGALSYASFDDRSTRQVDAVGMSGQLDSHSRSDLLGGRLEVGWRGAAAGFELTPYAAVDGADLALGRATEVAPLGGVGPLALTLPDQHQGEAQVLAGLRAAYRVRIGPAEVTPFMDVAYVHTFDARRSLTAAFAGAPTDEFSVTGASPGGDGVDLALGLEAQLNGRAHLFAQVLTDQADRYRSTSGQIGFRVSW